MRQNEDVQSARLQRLESQLNGAPHKRASRTNSRTSRASSHENLPLETSNGRQAYPSFPPPPTDDAREADVSSTASALSTLSSLSAESRDEHSRGERADSAEKERKVEEKEKESSEEDDSKRMTRGTISVSRQDDDSTPDRYLHWILLDPPDNQILLYPQDNLSLCHAPVSRA